jgi:hypothetical protein
MSEDKHQLTVGELKEALAIAPNPNAPVWVRDWDDQLNQESIRAARSVAVDFPGGSMTIGKD